MSHWVTRDSVSSIVAVVGSKGGEAVRRCELGQVIQSTLLDLGTYF